MARVAIADASWVIALRDPADLHHRRAVMVNDELGAATRVLLHPVTLAECLVGASVLGRTDEADSALRASFEVPDVDEAAPVRWAVLRASTSLRLPDAIVLDTALTHGADTIATFDARVVAEAHRRSISCPDTP